MKKSVLIIALFSITLSALAAPISGIVQKEGGSDAHTVVDSNTSKPIDKAKVSIPSKGISTMSDQNGEFKLNAKIQNQAIMSVEKEGYKPFSLTVTDQTLSKPLKLGIEQAKLGDIVIDSEIYHLGDDIYADTSSGAKQFRTKSVGPFYTKTFPIKNVDINSDVYLIIGSIIGIDTKTAMELGQNQVKNAYASAPQIYFNGQKISEILINGDHQEIKIPRGLIRENQNNELTIRTGKNLFTPYLDYDDIELMNLSIEVK